MAWIEDNWENMINQDWKKEHFPLVFSQGTYQSWNTAPENLATLGAFLRTRGPSRVLECGTFEARTTEYMAKLMLRHSPAPRLLMTIDVPANIDHIDEGSVRYFEAEPEYQAVLDIRKNRLGLLNQLEEIKIVYLEGLVRDWLYEAVWTDGVEFIYQDASHLPGLLVQEWKILETCKIGKGFIVCFDDMMQSGTRHGFAPWFEQNVKGWAMKFDETGRGQMWVEHL